ncbi:hypothetical protein [Microbacterium sp. USHLN186]|uniref:hypothetical protein n=1 Tax=Microbacterium sp. USHLN186 TaxID=3081286 RepID=UPI003015ACAC
MSDVTPPHSEQAPAERRPMGSKLLRGAIWIAIGALIAAALVCVVWVLVGDQDGIIGRAFLTILLLALFAGVAIAEAHLAEKRPDWFALASMISWIIVLLVGAVKIWLPRSFSEYEFGWGPGRFFQFLLVIGILQLALLHVRMYVRASQRYVTTFTRVIVMVTFAMLAALVAMLVFFLTFPDQVDYSDLYWRIVIALAILAAVGTTLIPLLNALFAPRAPRPAAQPVAAQQQWPTYADGRTPLPVMPDGSPDWNAYYTGRPTYAPQLAQGFPVPDAGTQPTPHAGSAHAGREQGFPPPPPAVPVAPRTERTPDAATAPFAHVTDGRLTGAPGAPEGPGAPATPPAPPTPPVPPAPDAARGPEAPR